MMDFNPQRPIYRQIVDFCFARILNDEWLGDRRIPSVRELAIRLTVNAHTVLKAFDYLQQHEIISPRRGLGFFVAPDAKERIAATLRSEFFETTLPDVFKQMDLLHISFDDIAASYLAFTAVQPEK